MTLRVPPDVKEQAVEFFAPLSARIAAMMEHHPPELIRQLVTVLDELHRAVTDVVDGLRSAPSRAGDDSPSAPSPTTR